MEELKCKLVELENMLRKDGYNSSNIVIQLLNEIQEQVNASVKQEINNIVCPECGMTAPMVGRLDSEYMACDACGTKWKYSEKV